jgi:hypothetical protein
MKCTVKAEQVMSLAKAEDAKHTLVIHNTFTKEYEMTSYLILAEKYEYIVHTIIVENRHGSESIHDVPKHRIDAQRDRFEVIL